MPHFSGRDSHTVEKSTRSTPRFPFVASAEILPEMGPGVGATVKEISLYGCFLEFTNPYPTRSRVTVKIFSESTLFEAKGAVIYAKPDVGMGVAFRSVKPQSMRVLQGWLLNAAQHNPPMPSNPLL
jgi:hypothetical protein